MSKKLKFHVIFFVCEITSNFKYPFVVLVNLLIPI